MITAVDTSVLLDVFAADPTFMPGSREALRASLAQGRLVACEVVWSECASFFSSPKLFAATMGRLGVDFVPLDERAAAAAGAAFRAYRARGGRRERVVADFLIGAHARSCADRLLTRDRGFYRGYFRGLAVYDPAG